MAGWFVGGGGGQRPECPLWVQDDSFVVTNLAKQVDTAAEPDSYPRLDHDGNLRLDDA